MGLAATGSDENVALAAVLAFMAAGFLIREPLQADGLFGENAFFDSLGDVMNAYQQQTGTA
ncbi:MAG: hypothetical protein PVH54_12745 [Gammaproteobacteria bacterium]